MATTYDFNASSSTPYMLHLFPDSQANVNVCSHIPLLHDARPWTGSLSAVGGNTDITHVGTQVLGVLDRFRNFVELRVPGTHGCPGASPDHMILGTSAEVYGIHFDSHNKRVLTKDGSDIPTPRNLKNVCAAEAILIPPDYSPTSDDSELGRKYNEWLQHRQQPKQQPMSKLTLAEYMGGTGQCSVLLADQYKSVAYFDRSKLAQDAYRLNQPITPMYGSLEDVQRDMDSDESFVRDAYAADVGIAGPPCGSFSRKNRTATNEDVAAASDLILQCVQMGLQCGHKCFVCENVCDMLTAKHGTVTAKLAALASEHNYVLHLCVLDPTAHSGCQTRPRLYFVFVQSALHLLRGKFDVTPNQTTGATRTILEYLMPVDRISNALLLPQDK